MKRSRHLMIGMAIATLFSLVSPVFAAPHRQAPPIPIQYGETVEGTISELQTTISYVFEAQQGDRVSVTVITISGDLDPLLALTTFDGTLLASDDDSGGELNAAILFSVPATGAYLLNVSRSTKNNANTLGDFLLTLNNAAGLQLPTVTETPESTPEVISTETPAIREVTPLESAAQRLRSIDPGVTVSGRLGGEATFNLYWFAGHADQEIRLIPDSTAEVQPLLLVYSADFTEILRSQPGDTLTVTLSDAGIYFIAAALLDVNRSGSYGFAFLETSPSTAGDQNALVYGQTATGTISNSNPTRRFSFRAFEGDTVTVALRAISGDLESLLLLVDSSGTTLAQGESAVGSSTEAQLTFTAPTTGDYFIIATRRGEEQGITAGDFLLTLNSNAPPRIPTEATPTLPPDFAGFRQITYGDTVSGSISSAAFLSVYVFQGKAGEVIQATMEATEGSTLDSLLILLDAGRIPLAENDDISETVKNAQLSFALPQTGFYALVATRFEQAEGTSQGEYILTLERTDALSLTPGQNLIGEFPATRLVTGETPSGSFDPLRFGSFYAFSAAANTLIDFAVTVDGQNLATVILTDSALNPIAISNNGILLAVTAPVSDDYLVMVMPRLGPAAQASEGYTVALNVSSGEIETAIETGATATVDDGNGASSDVPVTLAYGAVERGTINDEQSERRYVFQGRAGDIVEITMRSTGAQVLDTFLRLIDPAGQPFAENDDIQPGQVRDSQLTTTLPLDGQYTIVATRYEGDDADPTTGDYELSLVYQDPATAGVERIPTGIQYGETISGSIDDEVYLRFYVFEGRQGDNVEIIVETPERNLDSLMYLYTYTSANEPLLLEANDDSPLGNTWDPYINYTLPRNGTYLIAVTRYEQSGQLTSGSFRLTLRLKEQ